MPRKQLELPRNADVLIANCPLLTEEEKEILYNYLYGNIKDYIGEHNISRSTYYKKLRKAYSKLKECVGERAEEAGGEKSGETTGPSEGEEEEKTTRVKSRSDPERQAITQSLKVVGAEAGKKAVEITREEILVGRLFLEKFRIVKEMLGYRDWETFINDVYNAFMESDYYVRAVEQDIIKSIIEEATRETDRELLKKMAEAIEEISAP